MKKFILSILVIGTFVSGYQNFKCNMQSNKNKEVHKKFWNNGLITWKDIIKKNNQ